MNEEQTYIGITLGPVFDTVNLATSPASLWAASFLYSQLNRTICRLLTQNGVLEKDIITPYYSNDANDPLLSHNDGVGMFHDRIIFRAGEFDIHCFPDIRSTAIDEIAKLFNLDEAFLQEYVMARAVQFKAVNPIIESTSRLNCIELAKPFVQHCANNPILTIFGEQGEGRNNQIKEIARELTAAPCAQDDMVYQWQLLKRDGTIRQLGEIAADGVTQNRLKKHSYYALVRSDGDHMTEIMKSLSEEDSGDGSSEQKTDVLQRCRDFSRQCFVYCGKIADAVKEFGGVTIYAGGDDLLALLPCENRHGRTILDFIQTANETFDQCFQKYHKNTSLSFGILICYKKFPLYEGLEESEHLLFDIAKDRRNCVALRLQKHSGQSAGLRIDNGSLADLLEMQKVVLRPSKTAQDDTQANVDEKVILSALYKLETFKALLHEAKTESEIEELFTNLFDAEAHENSYFLHNRLPKFYYGLLTGKIQITSLTEKKLPKEDAMEASCANKAKKTADFSVEEKALQSLCCVLRIFKFFKEKEGKRE